MAQKNFIKDSIRILDVQAWDEESKRLIQYEKVNADPHLFKHTDELQDWLDNRGIAYQVNWVEESNLHPLFADMFNGFMKG